MAQKFKHDRIKVLARIRPLNQRELSKNDQYVLSTSSDGQYIELLQSNNHLLTSSKRFLLDGVYNEKISQEEIFQNIIPLLENYIDGYNCTIFTYGQTGTGKTFTMLGYDIWEMAHTSTNSDKSLTEIARDEAYMGIVPRSMKWLLGTLDKLQLTYTISISYVELYNDIKIIDLLDVTDFPKSTTGTTSGAAVSGTTAVSSSLEIRENKRGDIIVPGLTCIQVTTIDQILKLLWDGAKCRSIAATDMNDHSSRSHTVFIVYLQINSQNIHTGGIQEIKNSKLCLVDLAGSEKWKSHQMATFSEARIKELTSINRSLSALGNCISALLKTGRGHIPYRDSKLTRLLQDSLGGNTKTLFIVTLSPSLSSIEETTSTLQFADRAMKVQVMATSNTTTINSTSSSGNGNNSQFYEQEIQKYQQEIGRLKLLLQNLLHNSNSTNSTSQQSQTENLIPRLAREIQNLDRQGRHNSGTGIASTANGDEERNVGSNEFDLTACLSQELLELKEENMKLIEELCQAQEEVKNLNEEKRMILSAIYEEDGFSLEREYDDHGHGHDDEGEEDVADVRRIKLVYNSGESDDTATPTMNQRNAISKLQLRMLSLQQEELERKKEELDETDAIQEERWKWLQQYHSWLQTQTTPMDPSSLLSSSSDSTSRKIDEEIYHRVCLMEASILLQADELQRTKKLFLQVSPPSLPPSSGSLIFLPPRIQTNKNLQHELKDATNELDELYAEKGTLLERIEFLEDEIHKLLTESEKSSAAAEVQENNSPTRRERPSFIPVRIKPKTKTSAQTRFQYALGAKPPEPSGAPPPTSRNKPPEPSIPPPPGVLKSSVIRQTKSSPHPENEEIDVFSSEFSPQKFLDSLRMTHLGDFDFPPSSSSSSFTTAASTSAQVENSMTSTRIKSYLQSKFNGITPSEQNSPSPSYSSDTNSSSFNEEWQNAENQRVETRRKILSPSSAFLPVLESQKGGAGAGGGPPAAATVKGGTGGPISKKISSEPSKGKVVERKINVGKNLDTPSSPRKNVSGSVDCSTGSIPNSQKKGQPATNFTSVGGIDITAALAKANQIVDKHNNTNSNISSFSNSSLSFEEKGRNLHSPHGFQAEQQEEEGEEEETPTLSPFISNGNDSAVWMMVQDPNSERYYYYNQETQECTWERPIGERIQQAHSPKMTSLSDEEHRDDVASDDPTNDDDDVQPQPQSIQSSSHHSIDSNQFYYSRNLSAIEEEVEEEEIESSSTNDISPQHEEEMTTTVTRHATVSPTQDNNSFPLKSSFASAALRHIQRTVIQQQELSSEFPDDLHQHHDSSISGEDGSEQEIDAAAALALADEILRKRNIKTLDSRDKQSEGPGPDYQSPLNSEEQSEPQNLSERKPVKTSKKPKKLWRRLEDPTSKQPYYHNRATGETTWNRPTDEELELTL